MPAPDTAAYTYKHEDYGLTFAWEGGPYIDVWPAGSDYPTDTINVWDYATDAPTIDETQKDFEAACEDWLNDEIGMTRG